MLRFTTYLLALSAAASTALAQQSTTVCSRTACNKDNCYNNISKSTAFCASYTAPPQPGTTVATSTLNSIQASCGASRLSSACSCLFPPGATTVSPQASITQCTTVPTAGSPTVFSYNFNTPAPVSVGYSYNLQDSMVISDASIAHSPPNVLRARFTGANGAPYNVAYWVSDRMNANKNYTFEFWAKSDALANPNDGGFDYISLYVAGFKSGPVTNYNVRPAGGSQLLNILVTPGLDTTWRRYTGKFKSGDYLFYFIEFYFNKGISSTVVPNIYVDDVSLYETP